MGAKKYAYETMTDGKIELHITIAGVNKKKGAIELQQHGGLDAMQEGFTFVDAGGTALYYNDIKVPMHVQIQKHDVVITSNVVILDDTYKLGMKADYKRILSNFEDEYLDLELDEVC